MKKKTMNKLVLVIIGLSLIACQREVVPSGMIQWVENADNGLKQTKTFNEFTFEALYKPLEYVIALEGKTDELSLSEYKRLKGELEGLQYIDLKIKSNSSGNAISGNIQEEEEYYQRLDYFITHAQYDIQLIQGNDTLFPQLYHFERNYEILRYNSVLLAFKKSKNERADRILVINDRILNIGKVKFQFSQQNISELPDLKIKT